MHLLLVAVNLRLNGFSLLFTNKACSKLITDFSSTRNSNTESKGRQVTQVALVSTREGRRLSKQAEVS